MHRAPDGLFSAVPNSATLSIHTHSKAAQTSPTIQGFVKSATAPPNKKFPATSIWKYSANYFTLHLPPIQKTKCLPKPKLYKHNAQVSNIHLHKMLINNSFA